jgi:diguanylate cyclase (GGDEF)-like protein
MFYERLGHSIQRARREVREAAIMLIDLDGFKQINDTMGHSVGDRVLTTSASRLLACSRTPDTVARLGGDEFAVLLDGVITREGCVAMAQRIMLALAQPIETEGITIRTAGSVGVAISVAGVIDGDQLINEADIAMYAAKARHDPAGGFHIFDGTEAVVASLQY